MSVLEPRLNEAIRKLESVEEKTNKYLNRDMRKLLNSIVIREMKSIARAMNLPQHFINGIKFRKTGPNIGEVINTWGGTYNSSGQFAAPLALWFNYGTARHWIQPKTPGGVLTWIAGEGSNANAIFYKGNAQPGQRMYSKGHYVSGLPRTEAMEIGLARGMKLLSMKIDRESEGELKDNG